MESIVPEHLGIRISSDCKELDYREQTVTFVQLLLSMYPASVFSRCCLKESQMVVLSVTSAQRWDWEKGEGQLRSAGPLTLLTPDSGARLEKSQVVISLIFSGSQVISRRKSPQLVCIRSSRKYEDTCWSWKGLSIHSSLARSTPAWCQAPFSTPVTLQKIRRPHPFPQSGLNPSEQLEIKEVRKVKNHDSNSDNCYTEIKTEQFGSELLEMRWNCYLLSYVWLFATHRLSPARLLCSWIFQARILEWVTIPFSRGSSRPRDRTCVSWVSCIGKWILCTAPPGKPNVFIERIRATQMETALKK